MFTNMMSCPSNMYSVACWWGAILWLMSQRFISTSMPGTASISVEVMRRCAWLRRRGTARTELIEENKRMLKALSQRYPGQLELRAPLGATPLNLRMQAQTAARYEDILAHVTLTGAGSRDSRLLPIWDQTRVWDPGD